ncbi:protein AMN1 homolog [Dermacentor andersoni]|uniref:protein AMN1 homolog n=1 Tax=Dermacentor andersoni TaxID=34620 RepID=UPI00215516C7|nr:protein AMN1 homolog [Dermacentor andersoni]
MNILRRFGDVPLLKDMCLDALTDYSEAEWVQHLVLPPALADYYYARLHRRQLINDHLVPLVLHAKSLEADLSQNLITEGALIHLRRCTMLKKLTLSSWRLDDTLCEMSLLETVKCFHELEWLELSRLDAVTDAVLATVAKQNKHLTVVKLNGCENLGDDGLKALGQNCHFLKSVDFSETQITSRGLDALVKGPCSATLEEFLANRCSKLGADAVTTLMTNCPSLQILSLADCHQILFAPEAVPVRMERKGQLSWFVFC